MDSQVERRMAASALKSRREADAHIKAALDERDQFYEDQYGEPTTTKKTEAEPLATSTPKAKEEKTEKTKKRVRVEDPVKSDSETDESEDDDDASVKSVAEDDDEGASTSKKLGKRDPRKPPTAFW
jgi:hypothetical protein